MPETQESKARTIKMIIASKFLNAESLANIIATLYEKAIVSDESITQIDVTESENAYVVTLEATVKKSPWKG